MVPSWFEIWLEWIATVAVIIFLPFYMGFIHVSVGGAAAYTTVGSLAMTMGEELQFSHRSRPDLNDALVEVTVWASVIAAVGGVTYLLALLLV